MEIVLVEPDWVDGIWSQAEPWLRLSYDKAEYAMPEDLRWQLAKGKRGLWVLIHPELKVVGAGVSAIFTMNYGKMLKVEHIGGGDLKTWVEKLKVVEAYAKAQGCDRVSFQGRLGWMRLIDDYDAIAVTMEKRL